MLADKKIMLLGIIQSFFEGIKRLHVSSELSARDISTYCDHVGAMYIFVFMWTPALESTSNSELFHGWIFASFMVRTRDIQRAAIDIPSDVQCIISFVSCMPSCTALPADLRAHRQQLVLSAAQDGPQSGTILALHFYRCRCRVVCSGCDCGKHFICGCTCTFSSCHSIDINVFLSCACDCSITPCDWWRSSSSRSAAACSGLAWALCEVGECSAFACPCATT